MRSSVNRAAALGVLLVAAPLAWSAPTEGEKFKDWTVGCETLPGEGAKLDVEVEGADKNAAPETADKNAAAPAEQNAAAPAEGITICQITQLLNEKGSDQPVMQVAIGYLPGQEQPVAALTLPLGIWLPPGLQLQVDSGKKGRIPVDTCIPSGCRAGFELDAEFLASMRQGNQLNVTFGGGNRKPLTIPISLQGFSAALDSLKP